MMMIYYRIESESVLRTKSRSKAIVGWSTIELKDRSFVYIDDLGLWVMIYYRIESTPSSLAAMMDGAADDLL